MKVLFWRCFIYSSSAKCYVAIDVFLPNVEANGMHSCGNFQADKPTYKGVGLNLCRGFKEGKSYFVDFKSVPAALWIC